MLELRNTSVQRATAFVLRAPATVVIVIIILGEMGFGAAWLKKASRHRTFEKTTTVVEVFWLHIKAKE